MSVNNPPLSYSLFLESVLEDRPYVEQQDPAPIASQPIAQREVTAAKIQNLDIFADKIYQDLFKDLETLSSANIKGGEKLAVMDGTLTIQGSYLGQTLMRTIWNTVGYKYNRTDVSNRLKDIHKLAIKVFTELVLDPQSNEHHSEQAHFETLIKTAAQKVEDLRDHYQKKTRNDLLESTLPGSANLFADFSQLATNPESAVAEELLHPERYEDLAGRPISRGAITKERIIAFSKIADAVQTLDLYRVHIGPPSEDSRTITSADLNTLIEIVVKRDACKTIVLPWTTKVELGMAEIYEEIRELKKRCNMPEQPKDIFTELKNHGFKRCESTTTFVRE